MSRTLSSLKKILAIWTLAFMMTTTLVASSHSEGPLVPSPKLPPPPGATLLEDGSTLYADGCILYPDGTYVCPDGTTSQI